MWLLAMLITLAGAIVYANVRAQKAARAAAEARRLNLIARFGAEAAALILAGRYWQGATSEMLIESLGRPADVKERVLKTKTKHTYCYQLVAKNRFALKVHLENGVVVGWDDETRAQ